MHDHPLFHPVIPDTSQHDLFSDTKLFFGVDPHENRLVHIDVADRFPGFNRQFNQFGDVVLGLRVVVGELWQEAF